MRSKTFIIKIAATIMMLAVAFGPVGALQQTQVVHAATCDASTPGAIYIPDTVSGGGYYSCSNGLVTNGNTGASQQGPADTSCSGITGCLAWVIYWIGPGFASWVASISASFFNYIVNISLNSTAYALTFLTTSWTLVLSVANMFFIFILIYAAFTIMLKAETSRTMQILAWVIAIALVVNFSFFFTRVIIDGGNIIATQFYNAIVAQVGGNAVQGAPPVDITTNIMTSLGAQTPLTSQGFTNVQATIGAGNAPWSTLLVLTVVFLSTAILFWMMAFGLIMIAIKFLIRVVGLWFVLIASPLAFVSKTLPKTQRFFDTWLQTLVGFAFYPAIFLFMFYILNLFAADLAGGSALFTALSSQANTAAAAGSTPAAAMSLIGTLADVFIRMGFLLVMFYIMLKAADWVMEQSGSLASMAMNRGSAALIGGGFRTAANIGGFAGRNTVGRGANALSKSSTIAAGAQKTGLTGMLWRGAEGTTKRIGSSTFDIRNAPGAALVKKVFEKTSDISPNVGKAATKGYTEQTKEKSDRHDKERKERAAIVRDAANKEAIKRIAEDVKSGQAHDPKDVDRVKNLSKRETESLKANDLENITHIISGAQLKTVTDSDKFTDEEKEKLRIGWNEKNAEAPLQSANRVIKKLNDIDAHLTTEAKIGQIISGALIDKTSTEASLVHITSKIAETIARRDAIPASDKINRTVENQNLENLRKAEKEVENLNKERSKVPAQVGGHPDEGKFRAAQLMA